MNGIIPTILSCSQLDISMKQDFLSSGVQTAVPIRYTQKVCSKGKFSLKLSFQKNEIPHQLQRTTKKSAFFLQMQFLQNYKSRIKSLCRSCLLNDTFFWPLFCLFSVPLVYLVQNTESEILSSLRSWTWSYFLCINPEYTAQWCQTKTSKLNETDVKSQVKSQCCF